MLARVFFDQFVFPGFSKLVQTPQLIEIERIFDQLKLDVVLFSSYAFKIIAYFDAKSMAREAILIINFLFDKFWNQGILDRDYVLIKFVFYLANKHNFHQLNEERYSSLMEQILQQLPGMQQQLDQTSAITISKYEFVLQLITFFLAKVSTPDNHLKLLYRTFYTAYQFPEERFNNLDEFTLNCLLFDNPDPYDYVGAAESQAAKMMMLNTVRPVLKGMKYQSEIRKSFMTINSKYFVLKFNFKSKAHKFRYLILRPDRIAVLSKKDISKINSFNQKGVCKLIRFHR